MNNPSLTWNQFSQRNDNRNRVTIDETGAQPNNELPLPKVIEG